MTDFYILKVDSFFIKSGEQLTNDVFSAYKFPSNQLNQACSYRDRLNNKLKSNTVKVSRLCSSVTPFPLMNIGKRRGYNA